MDVFFLYATWLGSLLVLFPIAVALTAVFKKVLHLSDKCFILGSLLGVTLMSHVLKIVISRPRPTPTGEMIVNIPEDFSFPSAHTAQATSFFIALALIMTRDLPVKTRLIIWSVCGLIIAVVGYSRIHLEVHYIFDVVAGAALGISWVFILSWLIYGVASGGRHAQ